MYIELSEFDIFGTPNLVGSATVLTNYSPIVDTTYGKTYGANNLITNLGNRSKYWDVSPFIDATGTGASYNSCFRVDTSYLTGPYVFGLDHGFEKIQNAVMLVQDVLNNICDNNTAFLEKYYAAGWDVHIGNNPDYSLNPKCPGSPFLRRDYLDYLDEIDWCADFANYPSPAFGFKQFCNMRG